MLEPKIGFRDVIILLEGLLSPRTIFLFVSNEQSWVNLINLI